MKDKQFAKEGFAVSTKKDLWVDSRLCVELKGYNVFFSNLDTLSKLCTNFTTLIYLKGSFMLEIVMVFGQCLMSFLGKCLQVLLSQ